MKTNLYYLAVILLLNLHCSEKKELGMKKSKPKYKFFIQNDSVKPKDSVFTSYLDSNIRGIKDTLIMDTIINQQGINLKIYERISSEDLIRYVYRIDENSYNENNEIDVVDFYNVSYKMDIFKDNNLIKTIILNRENFKDLFTDSISHLEDYDKSTFVAINLNKIIKDKLLFEIRFGYPHGSDELYGIIFNIDKHGNLLNKKIKWD